MADHVRTTLSAIREAAGEHGKALAEMEDWELLAELDAIMLGRGSTAREYAQREAERYRPTLEQMLASGKSRSNSRIAKELNDAGILGPRGGLWTATSVRRLRQRLAA